MNRITGPNPSREPTPEEIKQANAIFNVIISIVVIAVIIIGIVWAITNRNSPNSDTVAVASPTVEPTESDEPETPEPSPSSTPVQNTLVVCNDADETAYVAISFEGSDTGTYETKGWWPVAPGECSQTFGPHSGLQYYAHTPSGKQWDGSQAHCVQHTKFDAIGDATDSTCNADADLRPFTPVESTDGAVTVTLPGS